MRVTERCSCGGVVEADGAVESWLRETVRVWRAGHPCSERDEHAITSGPVLSATFEGKTDETGWVDGIPGAPAVKVSAVPVWRFDGSEWLLCPWHGHVRALVVNPKLAGDIVMLRCSSEVEGTWCDVSAPGLADSWADEE